jgi:hypothetical protein
MVARGPPAGLRVGLFFRFSLFIIDIQDLNQLLVEIPLLLSNSLSISITPTKTPSTPRRRLLWPLE